jgi:hypothetical protein
VFAKVRQHFDFSCLRPRSDSMLAVFLQLGDMGTVLWIFILSAHTLVLLFLSRRPPVWFRPALLVLGWTVVIFMPVLGPILIARPDEP